MKNKQKIEFTSVNQDEITPGTKIIHIMFGKGTVKDVKYSGDAKVATIAFKKGKEKDIMLKYAKLHIVK